MSQSYTVDIESAPLAKKVTPEALDAYAAALFADRSIAGPAPSANLATNTVALSTSIDGPSPDYAFKVTGTSFFDAAKSAGLGTPTIAIFNVELDRVDQADRRELVSGGEVARRLKISRERVRQLSGNPARFPAPIATVGRDRVWRWVDVVDWYAQQHRLAYGEDRPRSKPAKHGLNKAAKRLVGRR